MFGFNYELITLYQVERPKDKKLLTLREKAFNESQEHGWTHLSTMQAACITYKGEKAYIPVISVDA